MTDSNNSLPNLLAKILVILGFIVALMTYINQFVSLIGDTQALHIASIAGYITFTISILWLAFRAPDITSTWRWRALAFLYIITIPYFFWVGTWIATFAPISSSPRVSLASISYAVNDFDPHRVNLRTASTSGIPVKGGQALRLFDLWFSATENVPIYGVQAEIYVNGYLLGATPPKPLTAGLTKLDSMQIKSYNDSNYSTSWNVQSDWKDLQVFLVTYRDGKVVDRNLTIVHLAEDGAAWFVEPPNVGFTSIVYTVNDGPEIILDMRDAWETGFGVTSGDKLTLQEIWYNSNATCRDCAVQAEMYLYTPPEGFNKETDQATPPNAVLRGIHKLDSAPLSWTIPADKQFMDLTLFRGDGPVMDNLVLPLSLPGKLGSAPLKGDKAPDFSLADTQGNIVRLSDEAAKHRSLVLVFYRGHW
jgi:hypothetical protein